MDFYQILTFKSKQGYETSSIKVEVDSAAAEKLSVCRADFMHALENDIKPAFGSAQELLEGMVSRSVNLTLFIDNSWDKFSCNFSSIRYFCLKAFSSKYFYKVFDEISSRACSRNKFYYSWTLFFNFHTRYFALQVCLHERCFS